MALRSRSLPIFAVYDAERLRFSHAELTRKVISVFALIVSIAHLVNLFSRKFCAAIQYANTRAHLAHAVPRVIRFCSKKQVIGIDAKRSIAFVANQHAFWNMATKQFVANPVGETGTEIVIYPNYTVASVVLGAYPHPTFIGGAYLHLLKETSKKRLLSHAASKRKTALPGVKPRKDGGVSLTYFRGCLTNRKAIIPRAA